MIRLFKNIGCLNHKTFIKNHFLFQPFESRTENIFVFACSLQEQIKYSFGVFRKEGFLKHKIQKNTTRANNFQEDKPKQLFKSKTSQNIITDDKNHKNNHNVASIENENSQYSFQESPQFALQQQQNNSNHNNKYARDISAFKAAKTVKQLINCIYENDHIKRTKMEPTLPFFITRMNQLLTKEEYLKNQKEISSIIYDLKSYTNQKQSSADQILAFFYFFKKAKDCGYNNKTEGFQVRYTTRLFQFLKNNQLTFQQILFAYYITAYLGCSSHEFKWQFTLSLVKQFQIYNKNKNRTASQQLLKQSIILSSKNIWTSPRTTFLRPLQFLMIMSTYRFNMCHLITDFLIYDFVIQNIWSQKIHNIMNLTQKVELFNIYMSVTLFFLIKKHRLNLMFQLIPLNLQFFNFIKKQPNFYQNTKWISIIQSINFYEFNYNILNRMTNKNIVNEFSRKIADCIISPTYHIPSEIIMKFLITPVINKAIKTLYETDQSKMIKILDFVKHYFTQQFFKSKQLLNLWVGFINVDFQKIHDKSIFSTIFIKQLYSEIIMKNLQIDLVSQTYWMIQFSSISFLSQEQIQERLELIMSNIKILSQSSRIIQSSNFYKVICRFYAYLTKYLQVHSSQIQKNNTKLIQLKAIKQSLKKTLFKSILEKQLNSFFPQKIIQKISTTKFNIIQFYQIVIWETKYHQQHDLAAELFQEIQSNVQHYAKQVPIKHTKQIYCMKIILMMKNKSKNAQLRRKTSQIFKLFSNKLNSFLILQSFQASIYPNAKKNNFQYTITDFSPLQVQFDQQLIKQNFQFFYSNLFQQISHGHFNFFQITIDNLLKYDIKLRDQIFGIAFPILQKGLKQGKFQLMKNSRFIFFLTKIIEQELITIQKNPNLMKVFQNIHIYSKKEIDAFALQRYTAQIVKNLIECDLLTTDVKASITSIKFPGKEFVFNLGPQIVKAIQSNFILNNKFLLEKYEQKLQNLNLGQVNLIFIAQFLHLKQKSYQHLLKVLKNHRQKSSFKTLLNTFTYSLPKYQAIVKQKKTLLNKVFFTRKQEIINILMNNQILSSQPKSFSEQQEKNIYSKIEYIRQFLSELNPNGETELKKQN